MISPEICAKLADYWKSRGVVCGKSSLGGALSGTELAEFWEHVGMPSQDWWLFRFVAPGSPVAGGAVAFGTVGVGWKLCYRPLANVCFVVDENGKEQFANSSAASFMEMLALFDRGCRRIQEECPGDSGADWDLGDGIIEEMAMRMRLVDQRAFEEESNLWPCLLVDING